MWSNDALARLVEDRLVHRATYIDPAIFALELERIFGRAWLYVAHESQLRNVGDFVTTRIGRERVIVARHDDGRIHAFFNRCTHRGAQVCSAASGNTRSFVCPYHAWSFRTDGSLDGIPHAAAGYGGGVARMHATLGL